MRILEYTKINSTIPVIVASLKKIFFKLRQLKYQLFKKFEKKKTQKTKRVISIFNRPIKYTKAMDTTFNLNKPRSV